VDRQATRAFASFGGVTAGIVCGQLKRSGSIPCRYEPGLKDVRKDRRALRRRHSTSPARDAPVKAKVKASVLVTDRWILARLSHETFFSLAVLNVRIAQLRAALTARPMHLYHARRGELIE
jgi:hypothetical protein